MHRGKLKIQLFRLYICLVKTNQSSLRNEQSKQYPRQDAYTGERPVQFLVFQYRHDFVGAAERTIDKDCKANPKKASIFIRVKNALNKLELALEILKHARNCNNEREFITTCIWVKISS